MKRKILELLGKIEKIFTWKREEHGLKKDLARSGKLGGKLIIMRATTTLI